MLLQRQRNGFNFFTELSDSCKNSTLKAFSGFALEMWSITGTQSDKSFRDKLKIHSQLLLSPREDPLSQDDPVQGLQTKTSSLKV